MDYEEPKICEQCYKSIPSSEEAASYMDGCKEIFFCYDCDSGFQNEILQREENQQFYA